MKKFIKILLLTILASMFIGTFVFLYKKAQPVPEVYEIQNAKVTNIIKKTVATGSVIPRKEIEIKPQVSGIVEQIYILAGQKIKSGDIIARVKIIPDMVNLNNAESRVNRAKLNLEDARIDFDRLTALFSKQVISKEEFQKGKLTFNSAKEESESA